MKQMRMSGLKKVLPGGGQKIQGGGHAKAEGFRGLASDTLALRRASLTTKLCVVWTFSKRTVSSKNNGETQRGCAPRRKCRTSNDCQQASRGRVSIRTQDRGQFYVGGSGLAPMSKHGPPPVLGERRKRTTPKPTNRRQ